MEASEGEAFRLAPDDTGRKESTMTHKDEDQTKDDRDACCERADPDEYFGGRAEIISGTISGLSFASSATTMPVQP